MVHNDAGHREPLFGRSGAAALVISVLSTLETISSPDVGQMTVPNRIHIEMDGSDGVQT